MATYSTREESWERHQNYAIDTEEEGKYDRRHWGAGRAYAIIEEVPAGSVVLEMGCNSGGLSVLLMRKGCLVYGVDVAPAMVARAYTKGVRAHIAPAEDVPYPAGNFDAVVASELLEHVHEPGDILKEAARVLKPGGTLVGTVPHENSYNTRRMPIEEHHYHARIYDEESLRRDVAKYLDDVRIRPIPFLVPPKELPKGQWFKPPKEMKHDIKKGLPQWHLFTARKPS